MAIFLRSVRALSEAAYEVTIGDSEGVKTFVFSHDEARRSLRPDDAYMRYAWRRLLGRDLMIAVGRFAQGQTVALPLQLEESATGNF